MKSNSNIPLDSIADKVDEFLLYTRKLYGKRDDDNVTLDAFVTQKVFLDDEDKKVKHFGVGECLYYDEAKSKDIIPMDVDKFCIEKIYGKFDPLKHILNLKTNEDTRSKHIHCYELIKWKYSEKFDNLIHALIEMYFLFFFNCEHPNCLEGGICVYRENLFEIYIDFILDSDYMNILMYENENFNVEFDLKELHGILEQAIIIQKKLPHNRTRRAQTTIEAYSSEFLFGEDYMAHLLNMYDTYFKIQMYDQIYCYMKSFGNGVLQWLPVHNYKNFTPEYRRYDNERRLLGKINLIARHRSNPDNLLLIDWKINIEKLSQQYCRLHLFETLLAEHFDCNIFIIHVSENNKSAIIQYPSDENCKCRTYFKRI